MGEKCQTKMCKSVFTVLWGKHAKEKQMLMTTGRKVYVEEGVVRHIFLHLLIFIGPCIYVEFSFILAKPIERLIAFCIGI